MVNKKYLRRPEAADYIGVSANYLAKLAMNPGGPTFSKLGAVVIYSRDDLDAWVAARRVASTLETSGA